MDVERKQGSLERARHALPTDHPCVRVVEWRFR